EHEHGRPRRRWQDRVGVVRVTAVEADQGMEVDYTAPLVLGRFPERQADSALVTVLFGEPVQEAGGLLGGAPPQFGGIAREIADTYSLMLLPPITISCSHEHADWPGTVSISARTLHQIITDVAESLDAQGVRRLLIVNGHGGNYVLSNIV